MGAVYYQHMLQYRDGLNNTHHVLFFGLLQVLFHNGTKNVVELKKFDCSGSPVAAKFKNHGNSRTNFIQKWKDLCGK